MQKVLLVDDHALMRKGVRQLLEEDPRVQVSCEEAATTREAEAKLAAGSYQLVLLDLSLPGGSGLDLLKKLHGEIPALPILIFSMHAEEQYALRAMQLGASGYLCKACAPDELVQAVQQVLQQGRFLSRSLTERMARQLSRKRKPALLPHEALSEREHQILTLMAKGKTVTEIAHELALSVKTVSTYRLRLLKKLGLRNNAELIAYAIRQGVCH